MQVRGMGQVLSVTTALLLMCIVFALLNDMFFTNRNITSLLRQVAPILIIGMGQSYVLITGGIDLSIGSLVGMSAMMRRHADDKWRACAHRATDYGAGVPVRGLSQWHTDRPGEIAPLHRDAGHDDHGPRRGADRQRQHEHRPDHSRRLGGIPRTLLLRQVRGAVHAGVDRDPAVSDL